VKDHLVPKSQITQDVAKELGLEVVEIGPVWPAAVEDYLSLEVRDFESMEEIPDSVLMRGWAPKDGD
jgi:hypothetical protein